MKKRFFMQLRKAVCLLVIASFSTWLPGGAVWAANLQPLSAVAIPTPSNLGDFVKDKAAAIKLGKALFWDQQVGSDGITACASCHYKAGADPLAVRAKNQLNPGPNANFDAVGLDQTLLVGMFPFLQVTGPATAELKNGLSTILNQDDIVGSQGVAAMQFTGLSGTAVDAGIQLDSPLFNHFRQVTGRNTPPAVNAIFNYANFWDGRANNTFNGNNPIGPLDVNSGVWINGDPSDPFLLKTKIAIPNASLASQATGPPLSSVEMSWAGRTWPLLGRKMLNPALVPLGLQQVSPNDSALKGLVNASGTGLNTTYKQMVMAAFQPKYWSAAITTPEGFTQMEANFSLFWGLAIQLYEATLVSDQTPFDMFLAGDNAAISDAAKAGLSLFNGKGGCNKCHSGSEFSDATVSFALANGLIEQGATGVNGAISDIGFHNLGIRPTAEDIGRGGVINFDLSFSRQALDWANGTLPFAPPQLLPNGATTTAVDGTFKTPALRNVELTAPYMHDGSMATLEEVVEFYSRGGNFANIEQDQDMSGGIVGVAKSATDKANLVAFLKSLTDPRVAGDFAPFDHPALPLPNSTYEAANNQLPATGGDLDGNYVDIITPFLAKAVETMTLANLPKATVAGVPAGPVNTSGKTLTVTVANGDTYTYAVDAGAAGAATPVATPINLSGLADGTHTITVIGVNSGTGHQQLANVSTKVTLTAKSTPPVVEVAPPETMTKKSNQTVTGTVEAGVINVTVSVDTGAVVGPVTVSGTTWSCQVSGLNKGSNKITITATDAAGNKQTKSATVKILISDGCFRGTGTADLSDALKALKMSVGIIPQTEDDLLHGDISADGRIDSGDSLMILKKVAGLASF